MREYLVKLREQRSETQQDVAAALGVSRQYYALIETGERQRKMDLTVITGLANHFGMTISELVEMETLFVSQNTTD